ncbi:MAG: aminoglycoside phosphotransferase family protein [Micromonosporaceae bacterium]
MRIPAQLRDTVGRHRDGRVWLRQLPALVRGLRERWELRLGSPYRTGSCAWVAPAGRDVVLKVSWPHREATCEPAALRAWDGWGAVRLLRHDPDRHAMLLERCDPGGTLGDADLPVRRRLELGGAALTALWRPAPDGHGFERLADVAAEWADRTEARMARLRPDFDPGLVRLGAGLLRSLPRSAPREVLLHGDFNPGNLLAARRTPWLAIDPKPMVGDPAYDPWPLWEQAASRFRAPAVAERGRMLAGLLGWELGRLAAWAVARCVESALWYVDLYPGGGAAHMARARVYAGLTDL